MRLASEERIAMMQWWADQLIALRINAIEMLDKGRDGSGD